MLVQLQLPCTAGRALSFRMPLTSRYTYASTCLTPACCYISISWPRLSLFDSQQHTPDSTLVLMWKTTFVPTACSASDICFQNVKLIDGCMCCDFVCILGGTRCAGSHEEPAASHTLSAEAQLGRDYLHAQGMQAACLWTPNRYCLPIAVVPFRSLGSTCIIPIACSNAYC